MKARYFPVHLLLAHKRKKDHNPGPYCGKEFFVPRENAKSVRVRLYRPVGESEDTVLPVLFNVHGGSWMFGDPEGVDLQSQYLANHLKCFVVNIHYLLVDERAFPYQQTEVADAAVYFLEHAETFHLDPAHAALMGYSAGGHISAGAAMLLRDRKVKLTRQVLCYPFLDFTGFDFASYSGMQGRKAKAFNRFAASVLFETLPLEHPLVSPCRAAPADLQGLAPAVIITCGKGDPLLPQGKDYAEKLNAAGIPAEYREYTAAEHGFMEHNFKDDPEVFANESEQDALMRQAVDYVASLKIFDALSD